MDASVRTWDHRSREEWLEEASRFERMAERFHHHPQLTASFSALACDAIVRAKDGRPAEARLVAGADWREGQCAAAAEPSASSDSEYFRHRATQELMAARQSCDLRVRRVHLELAMRYRALVTGAEDCGTEVRLVS